MSSFVHFDNKNKDILIHGERPTQGLDDAALPNKRFVLGLHYNGRNSFFFVNATKIY